MPDLTPRVVFDCNLFVQGIANRNSPARKALRLFFNGDISLFVSEPIIREVRDIYRSFARRFRFKFFNYLKHIAAVSINAVISCPHEILISRINKASGLLCDDAIH